MLLFVSIITFILLFLLAAFDFIYYRIPNFLVITLFFLFPFYVILSHDFSLLQSYWLFLITLSVGFIFFLLNYFGAGDAKFLAVTSLWVGWAKISPFLLLLGFLGGTLGVAYIYFPNFIKRIALSVKTLCQKITFLNQFINYFVKTDEINDAEIIQMHERRMIPYGVTIAIATFLVLVGWV